MRQPTPSNILITLVEGDSRLWPGLEVEELLYTGEAAEWESDAGMLEDAIAPNFQPGKLGTFYLFGFEAFYSKDYYGEVDADFSLNGWREATEADEVEFFEETKT